MATAEDAGRRTRSGRSAPIAITQSPRTRRKAAEDPEADSTDQEADIVVEPKETTPEEAMAIETVEDDQPTIVEETSDSSRETNEESSPEDQFIHIPDGNGVANNGIGDVDIEMADDEEEASVPNAVKEKESTQSIEAEDNKATPATPVVVTEAMISDDDQGNSLKRKTELAVDDVDTGTKKQKITGSDKVAEREVIKEPPKLPDLDKYWKPVTEDATNFTGWTYLLQYVDQESDVGAAREAYNAFLGHYPYCYGYWRKFADYEKTKGDKSKCEEVFERGLKAIPLSVDLWIHFLNYVKGSHADNETLIRAQYERALKVCGLEFRSDKLWEAYIKWETEGKRLENVVRIYDRLLATPTLGYNSHYGNFGDFVNGNAPELLLDKEKVAALQQEVTAERVGDGFDDEMDEAIRKKVIAARKKIHEATVQEVTNRWTFEEAVKRPYFHVKPLERCQLKNWSDYLDYEIGCGDRQRTIVLFERCLIACALYEEYWKKFVRFLMDSTAEEEKREEKQQLVHATRDVFERACTIHHKDKPRLHLAWSSFEESHGNIQKAADILANVDKAIPNLLQVEYRRINLERRRGNVESCEALFKEYISAAKNQHLASSLVIKYARFVHKIRHDLNRALAILKDGQKSDPNNVRIPLQMIDLAMQRAEIDEVEVIQIMDGVIDKDDLDADQKVLFAQRKVEFLEDFGRSPKQLQSAQKVLQTALANLQEQKKAKSLENNDAEMKQIHSTVASVAAAAPPPVQAPNQYANYSSYYGAGAEATSYGSYQDANYWNQYGQYAGNNYANYYQ